MLINSRFSTEKTLIPAPMSITPQITQQPQAKMEINTRTFENVQTIFNFIMANIATPKPNEALRSLKIQFYFQKFDTLSLLVVPSFCLNFHVLLGLQIRHNHGQNIR